MCLSDVWTQPNSKSVDRRLKQLQKIAREAGVLSFGNYRRTFADCMTTQQKKKKLRQILRDAGMHGMIQAQWNSLQVIRSNVICLLVGQCQLPVQRRVDYELACFVFSSLSGHAPPYLADDTHLVSESHRRRLRTHSTFGDRSFAVARPRVWNSLPAHLRIKDITYGSFRRELKTFLMLLPGRNETY